MHQSPRQQATILRLNNPGRDGRIRCSTSCLIDLAQYRKDKSVRQHDPPLTTAVVEGGRQANEPVTLMSILLVEDNAAALIVQHCKIHQPPDSAHEGAQYETHRKPCSVTKHLPHTVNHEESPAQYP